MSFRIQQTVPIVVTPAQSNPAPIAPVLVNSVPVQAQPSTSQLQDQIKQLQEQLHELKSAGLKLPNQDSAIVLAYHSPCPSPRR